MSEATQTQDIDNDLIITPEQELEGLKTKADTLGVKYHPSISAEKLRVKIKEYLEKGENEPVQVSEEVGTGAESIAEKRNRLRKDATKLVRVQITCMNPFKRDLDSEIFTAGNTFVGSVRRCVPFNTPWHVEEILLNTIRERKCQIFYNEKAENGQQVRRGKLIDEFAIQVLPPLTEKELKDLARIQAISRAED